MLAGLAPNGQSEYRGGGKPRQVMVGTLDGLVTLERGDGGAWDVAARSLEGCHISCIAVLPEQGLIFAGLHGDGLFVSGDGGAAWERKVNGLSSTHVFTVAPHEEDGELALYAGVEPAALYRSTDLGDSWEQLPSLTTVPGSDAWTFPGPPHQPHVKHITFDPDSPESIIASVEQGALLRSDDRGQTWREITGYDQDDDANYKDVHRVVLRPSNSKEWFVPGGEGLHYTPDAGETWERIPKPGAHIGYPDAFLFSPKDDRVAFIAGGFDSPGHWRETHTANAAIAKSADAGRTWKLLEEGLPSYLHDNVEAMTLYAWPDGYSIFAGTTGGDVFLSEDEGETWVQIGRGLPPVSKVGHYRLLAQGASTH